MTDENNVGNQLEAQSPAVSSPASSLPVSTPTAATKKESGRDIWKASVKSGLETVGDTETVIGTHRQIIDAGILGICVTFLIALLTLQRAAIDGNLQVAITAFAIAIPLIGWGYLQAAIKIKQGRKQLLLEAILTGSWVGEGVGELAAAVGMFFIFWHFSSAAAVAFIWAAVFAVIAVPILAFIGLFIYAARKSKEESATKQQAGNAGTSAPEQEVTDQTDSAP